MPGRVHEQSFPSFKTNIIISVMLHKIRVAIVVIVQVLLRHTVG
jgi:hypothetical protein